MTGPLLEVADLRVTFALRGLRKKFEALRGVSFSVQKGRTLGIVGESGSGKTTIGRVVLGLTRASGGSVTFKGRDIPVTNRKSPGTAPGLQVVFQDPYSSLNPAMTIGDILAEPLLVHGMRRDEAQGRIRGLLDSVHLPSDSIARRASEFSGGQRQRVAIARALALDPELIICDEPVSALDLTTQERILDLLSEIQDDRGVTYLFISHDLDVVRYMSDDVIVMRRGEIVESGPALEVTDHPSHPYTQNLLLASPVPNPVEQAARRARRQQLKEQGELEVA